MGFWDKLKKKFSKKKKPREGTHIELPWKVRSTKVKRNLKRRGNGKKK